MSLLLRFFLILWLLIKEATPEVLHKNISAYYSLPERAERKPAHAFGAW